MASRVVTGRANPPDTYHLPLSFTWSADGNPLFTFPAFDCIPLLAETTGPRIHAILFTALIADDYRPPLILQVHNEGGPNERHRAKM